MEERIMRRVADSAVIQTQLVLNSHLNGAGRLFGGQLRNDRRCSDRCCAPPRALQSDNCIG